MKNLLNSFPHHNSKQSHYVIQLLKFVNKIFFFLFFFGWGGDTLGSHNIIPKHNLFVNEHKRGFSSNLTANFIQKLMYMPFSAMWWKYSYLLAFAYQAKDIVFRFIIEYIVA